MPIPCKPVQHAGMVSASRLKQLQELAARTAELEKALADLGSLRVANRALSYRIRQLRLRDLRWWMMTRAEKAEMKKLEAELDKDLDEYNTGANGGDPFA